MAVADFVRPVAGRVMRRTFLGLSPHNVRRNLAERARRAKSRRRLADERPADVAASLPSRS